MKIWSLSGEKKLHLAQTIRHNAEKSVKKET